MPPFLVYTKKIIEHVLSPIFVQRTIRVLQERSNHQVPLTDEIDFAFTFSRGITVRNKNVGFNIKPSQSRSEVTTLLTQLNERQPQTICEIGTARGGMFYLFSRIASPDALLVSIDLPGGPFGGGYPKWKVPVYRSFARPDQSTVLIRDDSHSPHTADALRATLDGRPIDMLFIDGDHTYEGVKRDFEMYSPFVPKGGVIAFHDIIPGTAEQTGGVPKFWQEIRSRYTIQEIVEDREQAGYGIGVVFV